MLKMRGKMNKFWLIVTVGFLTLTLVSAYAILTYLTIHNQAFVKTVGVECDVTAIDWGIIEPDSYTNQIVHVRATGTVPVTLTFNTSNWNPTNAENYITLTWNYTGAFVTSAWTPINFTLNVKPTVSNITNFSFDITITGTG